MKARLPRYLLAIFVAFAGISFAFNFGAVARNDIVAIEPGGVARFKFLLWTADEQHYGVKIYSQAPDGWAVLIEPDSFTIDRNSGSEYIYTAGNRISATPVSIAVIPNSTAGEGNIIIRAVAGNGGDQLSFLQERYFNLTVQIGKPDTSQVMNDTKTKQNTTKPENISAKTEEKPADYILIFIIVAVIVIILISILIYRH
jgi:hypothetical protein